MISFIVPAHNQQAVLGQTLRAIHDSARVVGQPYEIVVVDDASTDATAEVARQHNARVVPVNHRQIAATRNSGARAAHGNRFFFVDADTLINSRAVASAIRAMDRGAAGGGAAVAVDDNTPLYIRLIAFVSVPFAKLAGFTGGAFMFCTRDAFHATGGFNERLYWAEDGGFAMALKREGRFVVLWHRVLTSGRRFRKTSALELFLGALRMILSPRKTFTQRSSVAKIWYDSNRADEDQIPNSFVVKTSNAIALVVLLLMLTGPLWNFVPHSLTPAGTVAGEIRFAIQIFLCHVGLLFWPIAVVLFWNLLRRKQWFEWLKLAALGAFCVWQGWGAARAVVWFWPWLLRPATG
jgi:glycosyltransferase involved in cell wall biosynthesis